MMDIFFLIMATLKYLIKDPIMILEGLIYIRIMYIHKIIIVDKINGFLFKLELILIIVLNKSTKLYMTC